MTHRIVEQWYRPLQSCCEFRWNWHSICIIK